MKKQNRKHRRVDIRKQEYDPETGTWEVEAYSHWTGKGATSYSKSLITSMRRALRGAGYRETFTDDEQ